MRVHVIQMRHFAVGAPAPIAIPCLEQVRVGELAEATGRELAATMLFRHPTVESIAQHLLTELGPENGAVGAAPRAGGQPDIEGADEAELVAMLAREVEAARAERGEG